MKKTLGIVAVVAMALSALILPATALALDGSVSHGPVKVGTVAGLPCTIKADLIVNDVNNNGLYYQLTFKSTATCIGATTVKAQARGYKGVSQCAISSWVSVSGSQAVASCKYPSSGSMSAGTFTGSDWATYAYGNFYKGTSKLEGKYVSVAWNN